MRVPSVDLSLLVGKLVPLGFTSPIRTRVRSSLSSFLPCKSGVPEGSLVSPFLFKIYLYDMFDLIGHSRIYVFADDVKL